MILFRSLPSQTLRPKNQYDVALLDKACCWCPEQGDVRLHASTVCLSLHCWIRPWTFNHLKRRIYPILDQVRCSASTCKTFTKSYSAWVLQLNAFYVFLNLVTCLKCVVVFYCMLHFNIYFMYALCSVMHYMFLPLP